VKRRASPLSRAAEKQPLVGLARLDAAPGEGSRPGGMTSAAFVMIMDRSVIQERLAETEERIANGENQIAQQRRLIAELETNGSPASHAKYLLAGLELLQTARRDSRDWLLKQLKSV
jgi:hypothetical protein